MKTITVTITVTSYEHLRSILDEQVESEQQTGEGITAYSIHPVDGLSLSNDDDDVAEYERQRIELENQ